MRGRYPKLPKSGVGLCISCKRWEVLGDHSRCLDCELYITMAALRRVEFLKSLETGESGETFDVEARFGQ